MAKEFNPFRLLINKELRLKTLITALLLLLLLIQVISYAQVKSGSFNFEGIIRSYLVFLPKSYNDTAKMPVVFNLHGWTLTAQQQMDYSKMNTVADTAGFIVVYPNAVNKTWNTGVSLLDNPNINDVKFIDALIDTLSKYYSINMNMIYSCGFSLGGFMSFRLACQLSNRISAVASVAGAIAQSTAISCNTKHPMPVLVIHGTADEIVPYNGAYDWYPVEKTLDFWIKFNKCGNSDTTTIPDSDPSDGCTVEKIKYKEGANKVSIAFYKVKNGGHTWPGGDKQFLYLSWGNIGKTNGDFNASGEIWNYFKPNKLTSAEVYSQHPNEFSLSQNYPNPFNPATNIRFKVADPRFVSLKVYDILGNEVATLVNEYKPAGTYKVSWNAENLSSGIYFYRIKAGSYIETKKMILLR